MSSRVPSLPLLRTPVEVPPTSCPFDIGQGIVCLGSCFAEAVGERFVEARLDALVNPLGPLYTPLAMARVMSPEAQPQAVEGPRGWHTWLTSTSLTRPTQAEATEAAARALAGLRQALLSARHLVLTLGTNHAYRLASSGLVVSNCHKHPAREFVEETHSVSAMTEALLGVLEPLHDANPQLTVTLTVSPYRYAKYGFHGNNLSKAALLLTTRELTARHPGWMQYFPAYEIVLDELRDYRFFADDMLHPSPQAVQYVWRRLHDSWFTPALQSHILEAERQRRHEAHRPIIS